MNKMTSSSNFEAWWLRVETTCLDSDENSL